MMTRSMLQIMLEFAAVVQVPESDLVQKNATPGLVDTPGAKALNGPSLRVLVTDTPPKDAHVAPQYDNDDSGLPTLTSNPSTHSGLSCCYSQSPIRGREGPRRS